MNFEIWYHFHVASHLLVASLVTANKHIQEPGAPMYKSQTGGVRSVRSHLDARLITLNDTNVSHASAPTGTSLASKTSDRGSSTKAGLSHSGPSLASTTSVRGGAAAKSAQLGRSKDNKCAVCGSDIHQTLKETCPKRRHRPYLNGASGPPNTPTST